MYTCTYVLCICNFICLCVYNLYIYIYTHTLVYAFVLRIPRVGDAELRTVARLTGRRLTCAQSQPTHGNPKSCLGSISPIIIHNHPKPEEPRRAVMCIYINIYIYQLSNSKTPSHRNTSSDASLDGCFIPTPFEARIPIARKSNQAKNKL